MRIYSRVITSEKSELLVMTISLTAFVLVYVPMIFGFTLPNPVRSSIEARPVWRFELSAMEQNPLMLVNLRYMYRFSNVASGSMDVRECLICGFRLKLGVSSQLAPFLFRAPSISFICSIHFDDQCLTSVNRVWYLKKNAIPTLCLGSNFDLKKYFNSNDELEDVESADFECQLKKKENSVNGFLTSKSNSLSVVAVDPTTILCDVNNEECDVNVEKWGDPQNLTSRLRVLQFNSNTQTWSYEFDRFSENESMDSSPSFMTSDKEVFSPCVSLECASVSSLDTIVEPLVTRCSSMVEIPLRKSARQKTRPQRYQGSWINGKAVGVEPVGEYENMESYQVDEIDGFLFFSFKTSQDLVKFCADQ